LLKREVPKQAEFVNVEYYLIVQFTVIMIGIYNQLSLKKEFNILPYSTKLKQFSTTSLLCIFTWR